MMTHDVHIIDPCTSEEWMQFITHHPDAGIFHHPAWMKMLKDIYGYRMFAVCLMDGKSIRAGIPFADVQSFITGKRWVSLPFSDHCQPLFPKDDSQAVDALIGYLKNKQGSETSKIEIRGGVECSQQVFTESSFVLHSLDLSGKSETSLVKSFNQQAQRSIKKAEKGGVVVKECTTFEDFEALYRLQVLTRKRLGVPAQPKIFFKGVWDYIIRQGLGCALLALGDGTPIGGGVYFKFNGTMFYKYGASDMKYKALQPNYAFTWSAIRRALSEGCTRFDFGRSDKENDGLRRFKLGWSSEERELSYTVLAEHAPRSDPSRLNFFTGAIIRHSPTFVCTLAGKLLYKHFA